MGIVVRLASFRKVSAAESTDHAQVSNLRSRAEFTQRDHADLTAWSTPDRRVTLCSGDMGAFAMLYQTGVTWASWGVVRQGRTVLLWDCVSHADIGRFPSMLDAIRAVPVAGQIVPVPSVLRFAAAQQHCGAAI